MTFKNYKEYKDFIEEDPNFTGVCIVLHENGQKRLEYNFVNGKPHGKRFGWYENGQKWFEENYINEKMHGKSISWYENGQKDYEFNYVNGYRIGIQLYDGETYEEKLEDGCTWYILVKEIL